MSLENKNILYEHRTLIKKKQKKIVFYFLFRQKQRKGD